MKKKFLLFIIIFFSFGYGIVVGKFEYFPYKIIQSKYLFLKKKIILSSNSSNFSRNENCVNELNQQIQTKEDTNYTIFIAGHTYGSHNDNNLGIYPKFYNKLRLGEKNFDFGIFAGDFTRDGNDQSWDFFDKQVSKLKFSIHLVPGNHDIGYDINNVQAKRYKNRYGNFYKSFKFKNDLFIILNPYEDKWSIKNQQYFFLKTILEQNYDLVDNIFIITHPVFYINDQFQVIPNSLGGAKNADKFAPDFDPVYEKIETVNKKFEFAKKNINFWSEIYPLFEKYINKYYIISGDVGAFDNGSELFCKKIDNNVFLATGMGSGKNDNYLIFKKTNQNIFVDVEKF